MSLNFGEIIQRAWQTIWKHKVLWIFGILAGCGQTSASNGSNSGYQYTSQQGSAQMENYFGNLTDAQMMLFVLIATLVVLFLVVLAILLGAIGQAGLIKGVQKANQPATDPLAGQMSFGAIFDAGKPFILRLIGMNLLVGLAVFGIIIAITLGALVVAIPTMGIALICLLPLLCLLAPIFWALNVLITLANNALVLENLSIMRSFSRAWEIFKPNLGNLLVMALIILVIEMVGGMAMGLPLLLISGPIFAALLLGGEVAVNSGLAVSLICFVVYLPVLLTLSGLLRSFSGAVWTLTYQRLAGDVKASPAPVIPISEPIPPAL